MTREPRSTERNAAPLLPAFPFQYRLGGRAPQLGLPGLGRLSAGLLASLLLFAPAARAADLGALLERYGIEPVNPAQKAPAFTLPTLAGGQHSLADERGHWVLLTFFATWCGPCRSELPTLEQLSRQPGQPVRLLGVALDDHAEPVAPFVRQMGLTFPVLLDSRGQVGGRYGASSIPASVLIDPQGRVVGFARGARDWSQVAPLFTRLPGAQAGDGTTELAEASPVPAPPKPMLSPPPTATVHLPLGETCPGEPFYLDVEVSWSGHREDYLLHPPEVHLPDGVRQERVSAETSSGEAAAGGANRLIYRLTLVADRPGRFALDPVELRYTPRGSDEPVTDNLGGATIDVRARTIAGLAPSTALIGGSGALLLGLGLFGLGRKLRARRDCRTPNGDPRLTCLAAAFDKARRCRLEGDRVGQFLALAEVESELGGSEDRELIASGLERARYGGQAPPPAELDGLMRRTERRIASLAPDPEADARQQLRFKAAAVDR